jgi:hypothetical protein
MTYTTPTPTTQSPTTQSPARLPVRTGTIVWGGILLLAAAIAATATLVNPVIYTPHFILWTIIGFGALLVLAGIIGAIARVSTKAQPEAPALGKPDKPEKPHDRDSSSDDTEPIAGGLFN